MKFLSDLEVFISYSLYLLQPVRVLQSQMAWSSCGMADGFVADWSDLVPHLTDFLHCFALERFSVLSSDSAAQFSSIRCTQPRGSPVDGLKEIFILGTFE